MTTIYQPAAITAGAAIASDVRRELLSRKKVGKNGLPFHTVREDQIKTRCVNYGLKMSHSYALKVRHFKTGF